MILQALKQYYDRRSSSDDSSIAPPGLEKQSIPFVIVLDRQGKFIDLEDTREADGTLKQGRTFTVPKGVKRSSGIKANLLWDKLSYVLGYNTDVSLDKLNLEKEEKKCRERHKAFIENIKTTLPGYDADEGVKAVVLFLSRGDYSKIYSHPVWSEVLKSTGYISFRLNTNTELVCQRASVIQCVTNPSNSLAGDKAICLITGERDDIADLHTAIKGVYGAQSSGGNIVSFNLQAFDSYGRKQGANAPVGKRAMFAYTTALNELLGRDSKQRMHIGNTSVVFWSEQESEMESLFPELMGEGNRDDPGRRTEAIKALYSSPKTGARPLENDETRFYVLGLAPNAARVSIRFWRVDTVKALVKNIRQYFDDITVLGGPNDENYPSLFRMLTATATLGKADNIIPNMAGEFMEAILSGGPFPRTLLAAALRRLHTGEHINHTTIALVKGYLVRFDKSRKNSEEELNVSLDESNTNHGYRLGRLFAVLERIQELASPGLNATIRDRYYGAASSTPGTIFPLLLRLKNHHIAKLQNRGAAVNLEKTIGQIMQALDGFPTHLSMPDQGKFAVGYYHQRQAFFVAKEKVEQTVGV